MESLFLFLSGGLIGFALAKFLSQLVRQRKERPSIPTPAPQPQTGKGLPEIEHRRAELNFYANGIVHPSDFLENEAFGDCVAIWSSTEHTDQELIRYSQHEEMVISCIALEALNRRGLEESLVPRAIKTLAGFGDWAIWFVLRLLRTCKSQHPIVGSVIAQTREWWLDNNNDIAQHVQEFVSDRVRAGEVPTFGNELSRLPAAKKRLIGRLLSRLTGNEVQTLVKELHEAEDSMLDLEFLGRIGTVWGDVSPDVLPYKNLQSDVRRLRETLLGEPSRSIMLVGDSGVGKTTLVKALAVEIQKLGWSVVESRAGEVMAGQIYIGMTEQRVRDLIQHLDRDNRVIWYVPDFVQLHYAGRHSRNPTSVLDMLLPAIRDGRLLVFAEVLPSAYEALARESRRITETFEVVRLEPLDDVETRELARAWVSQQSDPGSIPFTIEDSVLEEALSLAKQYLTTQQTPGSILRLLTAACRDALAASGDVHALQVDQLVTALTNLTGLPNRILDERVTIDMEELQGFFEERVLGQQEAVTCLVERAAMIKAGVCDPSKPSGVFLFVGPTGTGKTEIAKALAEFLFGSPDRMIRLDMSEYKTPGSTAKILGQIDEVAGATSLIDQIRRTPFSVVLLDEYEKAHPHIWDLFLQVFDDGRLTDARGRSGDFRHAIFIVTSNLGGTVNTGMSIGFVQGSTFFSEQAVRKAVATAFRPEMLNRFDRIVVFRPLSRAVMKEILGNELDRALQRRGIRTKRWAVEWDDSAIEFLLDKGFTADLGARPLKRAIDRYLLSPLAMTMVGHQMPKGDQFLYISSDGERMVVEFVDPDEEETAGTGATDQDDVPREDDVGLTGLILKPQGNEAEITALTAAYRTLADRITGDDWETVKSQCLGETEASGFWESDRRFAVLGTIEYMERIQSGLATAGSLVRRLGSSGDQGLYSGRLISRLAQQIYLIYEACIALDEGAPRDAFLQIEVNDNAVDKDRFARQLRDMYIDWARQRRMRFKELIDRRPGRTGRSILSVSGFGSHGILKNESGLHVLETPERERSFARHPVTVRVAPQPETPPWDEKDLLAQAEDALERVPPGRTIVRSYRLAPSPLVRDNIKGWRTGRADTVLAGNFDLFGRSLLDYRS